MFGFTLHQGLKNSFLALITPVAVALAASRLVSPPERGDRRELLSVRAQSLRLGETRAEDAYGHAVLPAQVTRRLSLCETWDYRMRPRASPSELRVNAPPAQVHEVGQAVWPTLDPQQVVIVV